MLKGISPLFTPELLATIYRMGHGDEIVLADAHFPGHTYNPNVLRSDGHSVTDLMDAILPLFSLDEYVKEPLIMMEAMKGDQLDPNVESGYRAVINKHFPNLPTIGRIDRFDFYDRTKKAFAVVMTGETRKYGNIILKKGVIPVK